MEAQRCCNDYKASLTKPLSFNYHAPIVVEKVSPGEWPRGGRHVRCRKGRDDGLRCSGTTPLGTRGGADLDLDATADDVPIRLGGSDDDGIWRAYTDDAYAHLAADLGAYGVPGRIEDRTDVFWWPALTEGPLTTVQNAACVFGEVVASALEVRKNGSEIICRAPPGQAGRNVPVAVSLNGGADKSIPYDDAFVYEKDLVDLLKIYPAEGSILGRF